MHASKSFADLAPAPSFVEPCDHSISQPGVFFELGEFRTFRPAGGVKVCTYGAVLAISGVPGDFAPHGRAVHAQRLGDDCVGFVVLEHGVNRAAGGFGEPSGSVCVAQGVHACQCAKQVLSSSFRFLG